ncbi:choice-of-anchor Q domain-containing protein [Nostoc sp. UHCC 0302]|uniref:choice-of-anchor Q domain-containing protein n=1 Tax=Nostoc sp. UHCC 0302 TaxID=3134896 RepID=UPI00311CDB2B
MRDNGGSVKTHALVSGSPAINAGKNADIPLDVTDVDKDGNTTEQVPFDQRGSGYRRISRRRVDIGAYEAVVANVINGATGMPRLK